VPFGHLNFRIVVLPLINPPSPPFTKGGKGRFSDEGYSIIKESEASKKGFIHLSKWLHKAQKIWEEKRGDKAERIDAVDWLDYRHKLSMQKQAKYKVLYPASATYLCSCVIEKKAIRIEIEGQELELQEFLVDYTEYYFETDKKAEAYYICSILNSPTVDDLIKPMQARGLFGPRHIVKKVWELPIPEFNPTNENHISLAMLGEECTKKVSKLLSKGMPQKSIGNLRRTIRSELKDEIKQIDWIVKGILKA